jgi:hypothetical protein
LSEHPLNRLSRAAIAEAESVYAASGSMADAIRAATKRASQEVAEKYAGNDMGEGERASLENRDVVNVLYCAGRLAPLEQKAAV